MKTNVASKSMPLWLKTRANSMVNAVPLPSSFTPGARLSSGALGSAGAAVRASGSAAGASRRRGGRGERAACLEALELLHDHAEPLFRDRSDQFDDPGIEIGFLG